ncbi:NAD(P)H-dependent oxidoreductase [Desulfovibrio litoralis]|uniref:NAD(P)H dehydrogenase (Quinone) n=1 Tax=Desulfovibrio litoralis DSM 11393 TaxID=1121455 RepID=A0A1M7TPK7_9BACT|nr:NAD(P)H-dependent oxidoreductase [Desulfovibrio litoralis]SHN72684.1 NAD(P)H dehydrogenase (quinone) [Desulfovibrio litoralis DSM 11393]
MRKSILIVYAHPESTSLTCQFADVAVATMRKQGHNVMVSNLYGMKWKAVFDEEDFPHRTNPERLSFITESGHSYATNQQPADITIEQQKLLEADALIMLFPLWWFGMPAIMKGWIDRVYAFGFAYGYKGQGNAYRYGDGMLKGKRAMLSVMVGGPYEDYSPRGINGPLEELLFPVTHGCLFFPGMDVLPTHAVYGAARITKEQVESAKKAWSYRLQHLFDETPIPFRSQNGGDYPDRHVLAEHIAPQKTGIMVHIAEISTANGNIPD